MRAPHWISLFPSLSHGSLAAACISPAPGQRLSLRTMASYKALAAALLLACCSAASGGWSRCAIAAPLVPHMPRPCVSHAAQPPDRFPPPLPAAGAASPGCACADQVFILSPPPQHTQILTLDNWGDAMHLAMARMNPATALYYVAIIVFGVYMILNLFLAILLDSLDQVCVCVGGGMPAYSVIPGSHIFIHERVRAWI